MSLSCSSYSGEKQNVNFEKYVNLHLTSHRKLEESGHNEGLGLTDDMKIQYFENFRKPDFLKFFPKQFKENLNLQVF